MNKGIIHQIIGPVIDIKFKEDEMPELLNAVEIKYDDRIIVTEVAQHIGDDVARCVALSSTDGLRRGMEAFDTGAAISVPVIVSPASVKVENVPTMLPASIGSRCSILSR